MPIIRSGLIPRGSCARNMSGPGTLRIWRVSITANANIPRKRGFPHHLDRRASWSFDPRATELVSSTHSQFLLGLAGCDLSPCIFPERYPSERPSFSSSRSRPEH